MLTVSPCAVASASDCWHLHHKGHQLAAHQHHTTADSNPAAHKGLTCQWASLCAVARYEKGARQLAVACSEQA